MRLALLLLLVAPSALAQGVGGRPADRLDAPGSPTDRYLDADEVRGVLHAANESFFLCFREHARDRSGAGDVALTMTVPRDGRPNPIGVEIGQSKEPLRPCLEAAAAALEFGDHDGDPLEISYPLVFVVDRQGMRVLDYPVVFTRPRPVRLPLFELPLDLTHAEVLLLERVLTVDAPPPEAAAPPAEEAAAPPEEEPQAEP